MKVLQAPHSILTKPTAPVRKFDGQLKKLVAEMVDTLEKQVNPEGVGLAANQVGVSLSLFVIKPQESLQPQVFINPRIIKQQGAKDSPSSKLAASPKLRGTSRNKKLEKTRLEGCLSIQNVWGTVERANKIRVRYQDITGAPHEKWFAGFAAVIIQHEIDHLQGVLFTQRALEQAGKLYKEVGGELEEYEI